MILRERTRVKATPGQTWAILHDPRRMSNWNPHCVECEAAEDAMRVGLHFQATMRFGSGPERQLDCEVVACQPERILTLRFAGEGAAGTDEYVDETYRFQPVEGGVNVIHEVDFSHSGLPWFPKIVLKVIHLLGQSQGRSPLDVLKELAEGASG